MIGLKNGHGIPAIVTQVEYGDKETTYLLESDGSEMWATLKDIRECGKASGGSKGIMLINIRT